MDAIIYGATGYTGRLVTAALIERGLEIGVAGRDKKRLEALTDELGAISTARVARVHHDGELRQAFDDARIVINCAGPFGRLGHPIVEAAIDSGCHYLDSAGEQAFIKSVYERFEAAAHKAGLCVVNGFAFEVALGDWAAELAARALPGPPLDELSVSYAVDRFKTTTGTRLSILASLEAGGVTWNHECWEPTVLAAQARPVTFPEPFGLRDTLSFPSGEVITVPRHIDASRVQTFISVAEDSALSRIFSQGASLVSPLLGALISSPLGAFARAKLAERSHDPTDEERERSLFAIVARAERSFERREVGISGADPYGVSAAILAWGAEQLLDPGPAAVGVVAPAEAFDPGDGLRAIAELAGLSVVRQ